MFLLAAPFCTVHQRKLIERNGKEQCYMSRIADIGKVEYLIALFHSTWYASRWESEMYRRFFFCISDIFSNVHLHTEIVSFSSVISISISTWTLFIRLWCPMPIRFQSISVRQHEFTTKWWRQRTTVRKSIWLHANQLLRDCLLIPALSCTIWHGYTQVICLSC